jgi:hypothetical protein
VANIGHWSTIEPFLKAENKPSWVVGEDVKRIQAYDVYESIYWTAPESFQLTLRGQEGSPVYVPSGRQIVDTAQRYMAPKMQVIPDPAFGSDTERAAAALWWSDFAAREQFYGKFSANKMDGLRRGDWLWHLYADPLRPDGRRISIYPLDPAFYFPEYLNGDIGNLVAVHLVEPVIVGNTSMVAKLTYRKTTGQGGPSPITQSFNYYKADEWGQPDTDMKLGAVQFVPEQYEDENGVVKVRHAGYDDVPLPDLITSLPVYHVPNAYETNQVWGSSEMRGIEILMKAVNQGATDEDITLIMEGLGVYWTDAGSPVDENDEEIPWNLGPARVVEVPNGKTFGRVNSSGSITPYQDHLRYLESWLDSISGANDITKGRAEVQVAESGIALALRMGPLLSKMDEKEIGVDAVHAQLFFDLTTMWFPAYEPTAPNFTNVRLKPVYGEKIPVNKKQVFDEVMAMLGTVPPTISTQEARRQLTKIGWEFPEGTEVFTQILTEQEMFLQVQAEASAPAIELTGSTDVPDATDTTDQTSE